MTRYFVFLAIPLSTAAQAQMTPVGTWHSIDDANGKPKAEIIMRDSGGVLVGKVERRLQAPSAEPLCSLCTDDRKGQPKIGMEIIRGAQRSGADAVWEGGTIVDPENGKVYKLRLTPQDGGKALQVRGYIGPFFRNQLWQRVQ